MTVTGFSAKTLLDAEESTGSGVTLNGGDYSIEWHCRNVEQRNGAIAKAERLRWDDMA